MMDRREIAFALTALSGFASPAHAFDELKQERNAQARLAKSGDPIWAKLRACKVGYNERSGLYSLTPTAEVKALVGQRVTIKGFVLPLDGLDMTRHFLLGVNTPVCMFHPPGEPNEVVEVNSIKPVRWTDKQTAVLGMFTLIKNAEMGVFFSMSGATPA